MILILTKSVWPLSQIIQIIQIRWSHWIVFSFQDDLLFMLHFCFWKKCALFEVHIIFSWILFLFLIAQFLLLAPFSIQSPRPAVFFILFFYFFWYFQFELSCQPSSASAVIVVLLQLFAKLLLLLLLLLLKSLLSWLSLLLLFWLWRWRCRPEGENKAFKRETHSTSILYTASHPIQHTSHILIYLCTWCI